jgi:uncharacterized protein YdaU (DUF1376 family)
MHYFKRNIGDYHKKAGRLSMIEHGAYTLLIDSCYDRERFPTLDDAIEWSWARTDEEIAAVKFVLGKFFNLIEGCYVQDRISEEIAKYHSNANTNKRIAIEREEVRRTKRTRTVNEPPPNQEPRTKNQEPRTKTSTSQKPTQPSAAFVLPDWVNAEKWDLWIQTRKGKKMIPEQMHAQVNKLCRWRDEGHDHCAALANAADNGWTGLFLPNAGKSDFKTSAEKKQEAWDAVADDFLGTDQHKTIEGECKPC